MIIALAGEIARIILTYVAPIGLLIYLFVCGFALFLFALIIHSKDNKSEADITQAMQEIIKSKETDPLLLT